MVTMSYSITNFSHYILKCWIDFVSHLLLDPYSLGRENRYGSLGRGLGPRTSPKTSKLETRTHGLILHGCCKKPYRPERGVGPVPPVPHGDVTYDATTFWCWSCPVPPSGRYGFLHQPVSCTNHVISTHVYFFHLAGF